MSGNILKISEASSLALHAMIILAQNQDKLISVKDISMALDVSANHLSKVMQRLNKAGYIDSIKGFNGGFKLSEKPEKITFLDIYELFEGKLKCNNCLLTNQKCEGECILGDLVSSVNKMAHEKFSKTRLSDFVNSRKII